MCLIQVYDTRRLACAQSASPRPIYQLAFETEFVDRPVKFALSTDWLVGPLCRSLSKYFVEQTHHSRGVYVQTASLNAMET